ncbi:MAG: gluconate 2-dehydrogenase subunit 3 family protein [Candidatus Acidiferrales bacterium]
MSISRRDLLKSLSVTAVAGSALRVVRLEAAEHAHRMVRAEKAASTSGGYTPKYLSAHQYETLRALCQAIIPPDDESGGALEAGVPEFLDLLTSENKDYQLQLGGGILWLDSTCNDCYGQSYLECTRVQQEEILDLIAYRKIVEKDPRLSPGVEFFSMLRKFTADGFFTSQIGIKYLGYIGNTYLKEFPGCPAIPEA